MNNLEKEILKAIEGEMVTENQGDFCLYKGGESQAAAKAAASVAMKEIHEAYLAGVSYTAWYHNHGSEPKPPNLQEYMAKFSGLTPTEPDIKEQNPIAEYKTIDGIRYRME